MTSAGRSIAGLDDGEFVAAEPGDEIGLADAAAQPAGDAFQQFVADRVAERVVDALEFVDVDIEHGELLAAARHAAARARAVRGTARGSADRSAHRNAPGA